MKRLVFIFAFLIVCSAIQANARGIMTMCGAGVSSAVSYQCTDATHDSANNAVTACEDFDGAATCTASYTDNCRVAWLVGAGTPDYDNTANKIQGTYSAFLDITGANGCFIYRAVDSADVYYTYSHIKIVASPTANRKIVSMQATGSAKHTLTLNSNGTLNVNAGTNVSTTGTLTQGKTYAIWTGYESASADPGSDGYAYVAFAEVTDGTPPAKPALCDPSGTTCSAASTAVLANGTNDSPVNRIYWGLAATDTTMQISFDHVRVKTTDFGSNVP